MSKLDQYLAEIKAREEAATPGPWETQTDAIISIHSKRKYDLVFDAGIAPYRPTLVDLNFIKHARTDIPRLRAMVEAARNAAVSYRQAAHYIPNSDLWEHWVVEGQKAFAELGRLAGEKP